MKQEKLRMVDCSLHPIIHRYCLYENKKVYRYILIFLETFFKINSSLLSSLYMLHKKAVSILPLPIIGMHTIQDRFTANKLFCHYTILLAK